MPSSLLIILHIWFVGFLVLACVSPLLCHSSHGEAPGETHHVLQVKSLLPNSVCSSLEARNTTGLSIFHLHGPCAPVRNRTKPPTVTQLLLEDEFRAKSLRTRNANDPTASFDSIPARSGRYIGAGNYVVTIGLGTPRKDLTVVFDTGSVLTWVQCQPCVKGCYTQEEPIFDPAQSSSYTNVSCSSTECAAIPSATGNPTSCSGSTCLYAIQYGDGSYTVGFAAKETLTLSNSDITPNFLFGCGEKNNGLFGRAAGLLGLGRDKKSIVYQKYSSMFSYCLPSTSSSVGYLNIGSDSGYSPSSSLQFTPMLTDDSQPSFYFIDLIGIKVGGRQLQISPSIFQSAGTIIDSGTVITRLPPTAYSTLRSAFQQFMSRRYPAAPSLSILDTCYDLSASSTVVIPTVELLFQGQTSLKVDVSGTLYAASVSQVCLAFAGNSDPSDTSIIGNSQQKTAKVVYDVAGGRIGFGTGGCS